MKILLLGDASNYHATLATGLAALGHDVTVASDGSGWMQTQRHIDLSRRRGPLGGALLYARMRTLTGRRLRGFDVVQLASPGFVSLRPERLRPILDDLRRHNGVLCLTALGTDAVTVRNLTGPYPALPYSEWKVRGELTAWAQSPAAELVAWRARPLADYTDYFYSQLDGAVTALYEYHRILQQEFPALPVAYGGIPVDTGSLPAPSLHPAGDTVNILYAAHRGREAEKGADVLFDILNRLKADLPARVNILTPDNMPFSRFVTTLAQADMVCDQLYSFTPATTALMAMAMGVVPITGGEQDFYDFIGERTSAPIFNPVPDDIEATFTRLRDLVSDNALLHEKSAAGPGFVERHNSAKVVARRFCDFWEKIVR